MTGLNLRIGVARLVLAILVLHCLWWLGGLDHWILVLLRIPLDTYIPNIFDHIERVVALDRDRWLLLTSILANDGRYHALFISWGVLAKCVIWIPSALALTIATVPWQPKRWLICLLSALLISTVMLIVNIATEWVLFVNSNPSIWVKLDPDIPGLGVIDAPYAEWTVFILNFFFYFILNGSMIAMPILTWLVICRREVAQFYTRL
jgi:hypothetical protein